MTSWRTVRITARAFADSPKGTPKGGFGATFGDGSFFYSCPCSSLKNAATVERMPLNIVAYWKSSKKKQA